MGFRRILLQPVGGARHGVIRTADFFLEKTGIPDLSKPCKSRKTIPHPADNGSAIPHPAGDDIAIPHRKEHVSTVLSSGDDNNAVLREAGLLTVSQWLRVPEQSLAEATNGELYFDHYGEVRELRAALTFYPEAVRRKKLAGQLLLMAQSGQYNYLRCLRHGEPAAAQLAVFEFVKNASAVIFLLNRRYRPYYKWSFRALRELPVLSEEAALFEYLLTTDNDTAAEEKYDVIEGICADVIDILAELRNLHIFAAV